MHAIDKLVLAEIVVTTIAEHEFSNCSGTVPVHTKLTNMVTLIGTRLSWKSANSKTHNTNQ